MGRRDELGARVAQRRRAGIAHVGDALAARQPLEHACRGGAFVVLVRRDQRLDDAEAVQQGGAVTRVFAGDRVDQGEHVKRAQADVGEIADRRGDNVQRGRGILLAGGGAGRGRDELRSLEQLMRPPAPAPTPSRSPTTKALGDAAEARALAHLSGAGLVLVRRNYRVARGPRARGGEVDLVMRDRDGTLVFVEVRARRDGIHGGAAASVDAAKRRRLVFAAGHFIARFATPPPCRFDVVAIDGDRVEWLRAAFDAG